MSAEIALVVAASLFAGFIDSIVGGGGLVLLPALFAAFPGLLPATLLGTNKSGAIAGTTVAAVRYGHRIRLAWKVLLPAALLALLGSFLGAWAVTRVEPASLRRLLPFVLAVVLAATLLQRDLGRTHQPRGSFAYQLGVTCTAALLVGAYDGFFGPGTGSFFIFLLVRLLGYDFLHASASAKVLNAATNLAALTLFAFKGHVWWQLGLGLAAANILGSLLGTRLALKHGTGFVRAVFILVVVALILKTAADALPF